MSLPWKMMAQPWLAQADGTYMTRRALHRISRAPESRRAFTGI